MITQITVLQVLLTPVTMGAAVIYLVNGSLLSWQLLLLGITWAMVGRAIRSFSHLRESPREIVLVPLMALVVAIVALPLKLWAAATMNEQGWLTRVDGDRVHGQREIHPAAQAGDHHA